MQVPWYGRYQYNNDVTRCNTTTSPIHLHACAMSTPFPALFLLLCSRWSHNEGKGMLRSSRLAEWARNHGKSGDITLMIIAGGPFVCV